MVTDRIKQIQTKINHKKKELKSMKKDLGRVKRWARKNPTKDLRVPFMGVVNVNQQIKQGQSKIKEQSADINRRKQRLRELKRG